MDTEPRRQLPHDAAFKAIYSSPVAIRDLLRGYVAGPGRPLDRKLLEALDLNALRKLPAEWITKDLRRRIGDQAWCVPLRYDGAAPGDYLVILLEFQSDQNPDMPMRMTEYTLEMYRDLVAQGVLSAGSVRPPVLCIISGCSRTPAARLDGLAGRGTEAQDACMVAAAA